MTLQVQAAKQTCWFRVGVWVSGFKQRFWPSAHPRRRRKALLVRKVRWIGQFPSLFILKGSSQGNVGARWMICSGRWSTNPCSKYSSAEHLVGCEEVSSSIPVISGLVVSNSYAAKGFPNTLCSMFIDEIRHELWKKSTKMWRFAIYLYNVGMSIYLFNIYIYIFNMSGFSIFQLSTDFFPKNPWWQHLVNVEVFRRDWCPQLALLNFFSEASLSSALAAEEKFVSAAGGSSEENAGGDGEWRATKSYLWGKIMRIQIWRIKTVCSQGFFCFHSLVPEILKGNRKRRAGHVFRVEVGMGVHMWLPLSQHPPIY